MRKHVLTIVFFLILAVGFVGTLLNLGTGFSFAERRVLSEFPKADSFSLSRWTWDDDIENYLSDHLPARDVLTGIGAYMRLYAGTERLDDIYVTRTGQLVESPVDSGEKNLASLEKNLKRLDRLASEEGMQMTVLVPPSAGFAARKDLRASLRPLYRDDMLLGEITGYPALAAVDLTDALCEGDGNRFYRTDNHWNADGAYAAYARYLESRGKTPVPAEAIEYESSPDFHGSTLSRSALWLTPHETIRYPIPACTYEVQIEQEPVRDDLYFREALTSYDPYAVFFNGNYGTVRLINRSPGGEGVLLVIKDSFANSLVPLLLPHYRTVVMIDPRFFRGSVHDLIVSEGVDELLCVCSLKTLVTDAKLRALPG
jgi:hypothetical protein